MVRAAIMYNLMYEDTSLALAVFLMLINPDAYEPRRNQPFTFLKWPKIEFELDHQGQFTEMKDDTYLYNGAETKFSHSSICPH